MVSWVFPLYRIAYVNSGIHRTSHSLDYAHSHNSDSNAISTLFACHIALSLSLSLCPSLSPALFAHPPRTLIQMLCCQQLSRYAFCLLPFAICLHALSSRLFYVCVYVCVCLCMYMRGCVLVLLWVCFEPPFILGIDFRLLRP